MAVVSISIDCQPPYICVDRRLADDYLRYFDFRAAWPPMNYQERCLVDAYITFNSNSATGKVDFSILDSKSTCAP